MDYGNPALKHPIVPPCPATPRLFDRRPHARGGISGFLQGRHGMSIGLLCVVLSLQLFSCTSVCKSDILQLPQQLWIHIIDKYLHVLFHWQALILTGVLCTRISSCSMPPSQLSNQSKIHSGKATANKRTNCPFQFVDSCSYRVSSSTAHSAIACICQPKHIKVSCQVSNLPIAQQHLVPPCGLFTALSSYNSSGESLSLLTRLYAEFNFKLHGAFTECNYSILS